MVTNQSLTLIVNREKISENAVNINLKREELRLKCIVTRPLSGVLAIRLINLEISFQPRGFTVFRRNVGSDSKGRYSYRTGSFT